jgi:glycosyltransferase involved in cell wall biosynthesis
MGKSSPSGSGGSLMTDMRRPLRILQVSTTDRGGGAEGSAWNLFQAYRALGHDSWLAVGYKYSDDPNVLQIPKDACQSRWGRACLAAGRSLAPLEGRIRGVGYLHDVLRCIAEPRRLLEQQRGYEHFNFPGTRHLLDLTPKPPDIIHCHNLHGNYFDLRALPWLSQQVPVILNLRDAWLLSGHCAHSFDCERWKIGCGHCPYLSTYPSIKRDATSYNWQRKCNIYKKSRLYITTISQWLMDKVCASMLRGVQYHVIPNAIDLTLFQPGNQAEARRTLYLPDSAKIVLLIAHNEFKDYDTMESALSLLDRNDNAELIFICLGKSGADKLIGQGRMIYRGFEHNLERLVSYYRAADVFIHAAKDEAFGKTIVEAMACGVPVVATSVGGITEIIENDKMGFLVPFRDSYAMSVAVKRLLADSNLRSSMGEAGIAEARRRFGLERQVNAFLGWYLEIIEDWKQRNKRAEAILKNGKNTVMDGKAASAKTKRNNKPLK